ncbi:Signal peptidase complex subunit [Lachnellula hyalina]|uniref:Signal peptidase complex subunit 1 n=1 Tax=Lachnellula hyalina TaxID=1316788 RepID=A0A8H8R7G0_9HELO|nr:Signal peptidase complex subunit [Lachnellula hyalina]TVY29001.1 Signal peptidase complex subunit [Lachnellula hyalina]
MADQLLDQVREAAEGQIDFKGQELAELLATILLAAVGVISFVVGFINQDIKLALYLGLGGTALTLALIVPPWPFLNRHPVRWLPVGGVEKKSQGIMMDGQVIA